MIGGGALYPEIDQSGPISNEMSSKQRQSISFHFCLIFLSDRKLLDCSNYAIPTNCQGETKLIFEKIKSVIHGLAGEPENRKEPDQICWGRLFLRTLAFESPKLNFCGSEYILTGSLGGTNTKSDRSGWAPVEIFKSAKP